MATEVITSHLLTNYVIDATDYVILTSGASVASASGAAFQAIHDSSFTLIVAGLAVGQGNGLDLGNNAIGAGIMDVTIAVSGQVLGGRTSNGIHVRRDNSVISNAGQVEGGNSGISVSATTSAGRIVNDGLIVGRTVAGIVSTVVGNDGFVAFSNVSNTGDIFGGSNGITHTGDVQRTFNSGTITGVNTGIQFLGGTDAGGLLVHNSGTITGGSSSLASSNGTDDIRNTGTLVGNVELNAGSDRVTNAGTILGDVKLGQGEDLYFGTGGTVTGVILGDDGNDVLNGGSQADTMEGGNGNDTLRGGDGDDDLTGGANDDVMSGGAGADNLRGTSGNDILYGGADDDILSGGAGRDVVEGGSGRDSFVFFDATHSTTALPDTIRDFQRGADIIDLDDLVAGELAFAAFGPHTGGGTASVRLFTSGAGNVNVNIDVNGDGVTDMRIFVRGLTTLDATDFVL